MEQKNNIMPNSAPAHNQRNLLEWRKQTLLLESNGFLPIAKKPYFRIFSNNTTGVEIEMTVDILDTFYIFSAKATRVSGGKREELFDVASNYAKDVIEHVSKLYRK